MIQWKWMYWPCRANTVESIVQNYWIWFAPIRMDGVCVCFFFLPWVRREYNSRGIRKKNGWGGNALTFELENASPLCCVRSQHVYDNSRFPFMLHLCCEIMRIWLLHIVSLSARFTGSHQLRANIFVAKIGFRFHRRLRAMSKCSVVARKAVCVCLHDDTADAIHSTAVTKDATDKKQVNNSCFGFYSFTLSVWPAPSRQSRRALPILLNTARMLYRLSVDDRGQSFRPPLAFDVFSARCGCFDFQFDNIASAAEHPQKLIFIILKLKLDQEREPASKSILTAMRNEKKKKIKWINSEKIKPVDSHPTPNRFDEMSNGENHKRYIDVCSERNMDQKHVVKVPWNKWCLARCRCERRNECWTTTRTHIHRVAFETLVCSVAVGFKSLSLAHIVDQKGCAKDWK